MIQVSLDKGPVSRRVSCVRGLAALVVGTALGLAPAKAGILPDGVNLQPSYYNNGNVDMGWSLMNQNGNIKTTRIEIEPDKVTQAKTWIAQAVSNGKTVIATYHKSSVLGTDSTSELSAAGSWWASNYATLHASGSFTVNLMNEWGSHSISSNSYASAYNTAISSVRTVYSGRIICDIPGWGQETATAAAAVKGTNGTKINDTNIALSVHIYPSDWNQTLNHWLQNSDLDDMGSAGVPCIAGEFGSGGSGSADWSGLTDHARSLGWTVVGWAWNGDGGSMNMVSPSWSTNATATSFSKSSYFDTIYNKLSSSGGGGTVTVLNDFETGIEGWSGSYITGGPWQVNEFVAHGSYGLKADVSLASNAAYYLKKSASFNLTGKSQLQIRVRYATWGSWAGATAKLYVKTGSSWQWFDGGAVAINSSGSTTLTLNLGGVANVGDIREIGVQYLSGSGASGTSSIYCDYLTVQ